MRKVKALQLLAAASIAAVPTVAFGFDEGAGRPTHRPVLDHFGLRSPEVFNSTHLRGGKYTLAPNTIGGGPEADGTFTWVGPNLGSWLDAANWTPAGGPPTGNAAIAVINEQNNGGVIEVNGAITMSQINFADPQAAGIIGPVSGLAQTLTMAGNRTLNISQFLPEEFPATGVFFGVPIGADAAAPDPARPITIAGTNGLNITGNNHALHIQFPNTYTGNTTITNMRVTVNTNAGDQAFGGGADAVHLNNGGVAVFQASGVTFNRPFVVGAGGGSFTFGTTATFNGDIGGSGALHINSDFANGLGIFTADNTFSGALSFGAGTQTISGNGAFKNVSSILGNGTVILEGAVAEVGGRLSNTANLSLGGSTLRMNGFSGTEVVGSTTIRGGTSAIIMQGGSGTYSGGNITRTQNGGLEVQAEGLSSLNKVFFTNGASQLVNGVFKYAFVQPQNLSSHGIEDNFTELATYGVNGLTPISSAGGYVDSTLTGTTVASNVRLRSGFDGDQSTTETNAPTSYSVAGTVNVNSLVLAPGWSVDDVGSANGLNGVTITGNGVLNVASGVILNATSGFTPGNAINSGVGNVIDTGVTITTPQSELILASPGAMTVNGKISGNFGVTKTGIRTLFMNGQTSDYTGTTVLSGFNRHKGNLPNNAASAYGNSSSEIIIDLNSRIQQDPILGATGITGASFGPDDLQGPTSMDRPMRIRANDPRELFGVLLRNFSQGTFTMNGQVTVEQGADMIFQSLASTGVNTFVSNGKITGAGHVTLAQTQANLDVTINNGTNDYTGGFDHSGGTLHVGANSVGVGEGVTTGPFGTGRIVITVPASGTNNAFVSDTGPRTIGNNVLHAGANWIIGGSNPFTFTGDVEMQVSELVTVVPGNSMNITGNLKGGDLFKEGLGTMNLSGNNATHGQINAGNGSFAGGMIVMRSNNAAGSTVGVSAANAVDSTIGIADNAQIGDETMVMRGEGIGGLGSLRSLSGTNGWGGTVLVQQQNNAGTPLATKGTIGVDSGQLTLGKSIFTLATAGDGTPAGPLGVKKTGAGNLVVGHETFTSGTSSFQGAVLSSGSFEIAQGNVRLANVVADTHTPSVSDVASISIAPGSKLDIGKNALVVDYDGASPLAAIRSLIIQGAAIIPGNPPTITWTGNGITSSDAPSGGAFGIAYSENNVTLTNNNTANYTTFFGDPVDTTAVLVLWTRYGDANMDNNVGLTDFNRLAGNFGLIGGALWHQGDFNYDGNVNLQDFNLLAANFGLQAAPNGPTPDDWATLAAAVPEPSALGLVAVAGLSLLKRRRRDAR